MKKTRTLLAIALAAVLSSTAYGDFTWFNTATNAVANAGGVTPLSGHISDSSIGVFVQLIWAGANDQIDAANNTGTGVTLDDEVHSASWLGRGSFPPNDGFMPAFETLTSDNPGSYYVRVWTAPSDNFASGFVPTAPSNFYGNSELWLNPGNEPGPDEFNFGGEGDGNNIGFATTLQAVPEPTALALTLLGLFGLRRMIKRRRSDA